MFTKLSLLALVAPLMVSGLQVQIPENPTSGGSVTIKWTNEQGDPDTWTFELTNPSFNDAFAISNDVNPSASSLTLTLPIVPVGDGYTIEAVNIGNITDVFAQTGDFSIGATTTTVGSVSSTTVSTTGTAKTSSHSGSATVTETTPATTIVSSTGFSSLIVTTTPSASATSTAPATSSSASIVAPINSASRSAAGIAAFVLSAVAGVAMMNL